VRIVLISIGLLDIICDPEQWSVEKMHYCSGTRD
jgi:hypothetical protein